MPANSEKSVDLNRTENITKGQLSAKRTALYSYDSDLDQLDPINANNPLPVSATLTPAPIFDIRNIEEDATYKYFGFEERGGTNWRIMRKTLATSTFLYATGTTDYSTAWTTKASEVYA